MPRHARPGLQIGHPDGIVAVLPEHAEERAHGHRQGVVDGSVKVENNKVKAHAWSPGPAPENTVS